MFQKRWNWSTWRSSAKHVLIIPTKCSAFECKQLTRTPEAFAFTTNLTSASDKIPVFRTKTYSKEKMKEEHNTNPSVSSQVVQAANVAYIICLCRSTSIISTINIYLQFDVWHSQGGTPKTNTFLSCCIA